MIFYIYSLNLGPELEFERSEYAQKMRLVLAEIVSLMSQVQPVTANAETHPGTPVKIRPSELFDHQVILYMCPKLCTEEV